MKKLALSEARPGDILARAVTTASGVVLMRPGTALSADALVRLEALSIDTLYLEGPSPDATPLDEQLEALDRRFGGHEENRLMMELKALVAARLTQGASERRDG